MSRLMAESMDRNAGVRYVGLIARWNILSARGFDGLRREGVHADGAGLYLRVRGNARSWVFIYHHAGRRREMGLGALPGVGLATARSRAQAARELLAKGTDPLAIRQAIAPAIPTFGALADDWIKVRKSSVRSDKSVARWERMLGDKGPAATLRSVRVDLVDTNLIVHALKGCWEVVPSNFLARNYIEAVLDRGKALGHRAGDNPAKWKGHLENLLPPPEGLGEKHHAALPFGDVPRFMSQLRARQGVAARALEFTILTAARSGEAREATWAEIDLEQRVWTVPAARMKAGREHRVPLSDAAVAVLQPLRELGDGGFIFSGQKAGRPLSVMAMDMMLRRMDTPVTVHGFRSSFRDWAGETTEHVRETAEAALAHMVGDATERAYRRGDALEKRRTLMDAWAVYCGWLQPAPPADPEPTIGDSVKDA